MRQAFAVRDFRLLWAGGLISSVGTWLLTIAVPAQVLQLTGSLRDTGLTLAAEFLPQLVLGPVAGVAADRWDRRRVMAVSSVACAGAVAVMLLGLSPDSYWALYIALAAETSAAMFYTPALQARIPEVVGTGTLLSSASALNAMTKGAVAIVGGPLGGTLYALAGIRWLIGADVLSYLAAAAAVLMTSPAVPRPRVVASRVLTELAAGVRALRACPVARGLLSVQVLFLTANALLTAVLIPFGMRKLGGSEQTGLVMAALGAGFLAGAPVLRVLLDRAQPKHAMAGSLVMTAAGYVGLFSSTTVVLAMPAATVIGMSGAIILAVPVATVQRVMENEVLGRVSAVFAMGGAAAALLGAVAGPFLAEAIQLTGAALVAAGLALAASALALLIVPAVAGT